MHTTPTAPASSAAGIPRPNLYRLSQPFLDVVYSGGLKLLCRIRPHLRPSQLTHALGLIAILDKGRCCFDCTDCTAVIRVTHGLIALIQFAFLPTARVFRVKAFFPFGKIDPTFSSGRVRARLRARAGPRKHAKGD